MFREPGEGRGYNWPLGSCLLLFSICIVTMLRCRVRTRTGWLATYHAFCVSLVYIQGPALKIEMYILQQTTSFRVFTFQLMKV